MGTGLLRGRLLRGTLSGLHRPCGENAAAVYIPVRWPPEWVLCPNSPIPLK